jgi:putative hydrolase of the HAD superfamily
VRAVLFDVDGVLVHGYGYGNNPSQKRWDEALQEDLGIDPERFQREFIYDVFIKKVIIGKMALIEALDRVLPSLGYKGSPLTFIQYWLRNDSHINQPLIDLVKKLKEAAAPPLYLATNQEHMRAWWLWDTMGLGELFDDIFYSARLGVAKPDRGFYRDVMKRIGPQTEPPLFFDDSETNVKAARSHGWEAVLFVELEDFTKHPWIAERLK